MTLTPEQRAKFNERVEALVQYQSLDGLIRFRKMTNAQPEDTPVFDVNGYHSRDYVVELLTAAIHKRAALDVIEAIQQCEESRAEWLKGQLL